MRSVLDRVKEHYDEAISLGYEVVGVFLQGSQNYGLDDEFSDVDTKALVLPTFNDIVTNSTPISTTHVRANNEHIDIKDIRVMLKTLLKQNINFVEILFTEYYVLNPKYADLFQPLFDNREAVGRYNINAALNCMLGMAYEKQKALTHPYPATMDKIEKFGYDPKQLHHIIRMFEFMMNYINGMSYAECLTNNSGHCLKLIKRGHYSLKDAKLLAESFPNAMKVCRDSYVENNVNVINKDVEKLFNEVNDKILRQFLREELLKGV